MLDKKLKDSPPNAWVPYSISILFDHCTTLLLKLMLNIFIKLKYYIWDSKINWLIYNYSEILKNKNIFGILLEKGSEDHKKQIVEASYD